MNLNDCTVDARPLSRTVSSAAGLAFTILENGSVQSIQHDGIRLNLFAGSLLQEAYSNIYLRIRSDTIIAFPLMGPKSNSEHFAGENFFGVKGCYGDIAYSCRLLLSEQCCLWKWQIDIEYLGVGQVEVDLVYVQDVGLVPKANGESNEFYISQYIDYQVLNSPECGKIVCCRQNELAGEKIPWLALGATGSIESCLTDGLQFFGSQYRATGVGQALEMRHLPGLCQKESAIVAVQHEPFVLKANENSQCSFFGLYCQDHPAKTTESDLDFIHTGLKASEMIDSQMWPGEYESCSQCSSVFTESELFVSEDLNHDDLAFLFEGEKRHSEWKDGKLLSFFYGDNRHVVLKDKELMVDRPHGHIMQSGRSRVLDESVMCSTAYMSGVFGSQVCQGNVNFNRFITVHKSPFNVMRFSGQRVFVKLNGVYCQLAVPSAFEMEMNRCRWIYKFEGLLFEVVSEAKSDSNEFVLRFNVVKGDGIELMISSELEQTHGWKPVGGVSDTQKWDSVRFEPNGASQLSKLYPGGGYRVCFDEVKSVEQIGGDELLFVDGMSRRLNLFVVKADCAKKFSMRLVGELTANGVGSSNLYNLPNTEKVVFDFNMSLPSETNCEDMDEIMEMLPWLRQNAQVHYLTPHGLEQYGGAAWGTRDICQGPVEMLLSMGDYVRTKQILRKVFSSQETDGNWPQWWMFDRYHHIRCDESHGDVIFWPILALSEYLEASGDFDFLNEPLPYYSAGSVANIQTYSVLEHVQKCIEYIERCRFANGTWLVNYSDGDWNDSLQPANPKLKQKLISSWTVALSYQVFNAFADVCRAAAYNDLADQIAIRCNNIKSDFNKFLVKDGIVAGFGYFRDNENIDLLLHPSDKATSIHYRLLPMIRGIISGIFTAEQASSHLDIIEKYLKGPDGARLMDRPPRYNSGLKTFFKRAESSPFFGREIGLMYTHAHLRYCQSLAKLGRADDFLKSIRQIVPINLQEFVKGASLRQSNCYYSSSDADFCSRYEVDRSYDDIQLGNIAFNGGWRIYSSGPGIAVRLVLSHLFGIRHSYGKVVFDPVLSKRVDGLEINIELCGHAVTVAYSVQRSGSGVREVCVNKVKCEFTRQENPYRTGGAMIDTDKLISMLRPNGNRIEIFI